MISYFSEEPKKYMIVGGMQYNTSEVISLDKNNTAIVLVDLNSQLPSTEWGAVGGIIGNVPILCGLFKKDYCLTFQNSSWSNLNLSMIEEGREYAASIQVNSTSIWVVGGKKHDTNPWVFMDSTEFINQNASKAIAGPKLPYKMYGMCMIKLSEDQIYVIGGRNETLGYMNEVWIFNPKNGFNKTQGLSMKTERMFHACGTMNDGNDTLIVVAGGYNENGSLDSVEIYNQTENKWFAGEIP